MQSTALAPNQPAPALTRQGTAPILTPDDFNARIAQLAQHCHVLSPAMHISSIAPMHSVNVSHVTIDPTVQMDKEGDPSNGVGVHTYFSKALNMKPNERALNKNGLLIIASAGGGSWRDSRQTSDPTIQDLWSWNVMLTVKMPDGTPTDYPGSATVDYRKGSAQLAGMSDKQLLNARKKGAERAETLAMERAIRAAFALRHKYTVDELRKPFVAFKLVFAPDMRDPDTRAAITAHALGSTAALYGGSRPALTGEVVNREPVPTSPAAAAATPCVTAPAEIDELPATSTTKPATAQTAQAFTIAKVFRQPRDGQEPIYYLLTAETGDTRLHTEDSELATAAAAAKKDNVRVALQLQEEENPETRAMEQWVLKLTPIPAPAVTSTSTNVPADARFVMDVQSKSGNTNGRAWTRWTVSFENGDVATTFSSTDGPLAAEAMAGKLPVRVALKAKEKYPDELDLVEIAIVDTKQQGLY